MDKDYLEKNNLKRICRTFIGNKVCCVVPNEVFEHDRPNGFKNINKSLAESFNYDLVEPTIKSLKSNNLAVSISTHSVHESELHHAISYKKIELEQHIDTQYIADDVYFFIYVSPATYHNMNKSQYLRISNSFDRLDSKLLGITCKPHQTIKSNQLWLCALPKKIIEKETAIPEFVKEIIENQ